MKTKKPSKQRNRIRKAPLHRKQKLIASHLVKTLAQQYKKRSLGARKGDEVKILRGDFKGKTGKIAKINLKKMRVFIEGVKRKRVSGEEVLIPIHPSNIILTTVTMDDKKRKNILERK